MKNEHHCDQLHSKDQSSTSPSPKIVATGKQYLRRIQTLLFLLLIFISIIIVEGSSFLAFSSSLLYYPTLPFAALAAPTTLMLLLLFSQQDRETIRVTAAILLFS
ncbi:hypothetical protein [uncultured Actinomyces sp.]|uniref:hypothetical protein n=1 Tax=uncultured Actinomyces sp. TaxID=249061 RepID=UPI0028EBE9D7|nr:hypothetical protein [uncultured Actinomyces sp.]